MKTAADLYNLKKEQYERFPEQRHCIYRSLYDPEFIHYHKTLRTNMKKWVDSGEKGFRRVDLALAAASWTINKHMPFATEWDPEHSPQDYIPLDVKTQDPDDIEPAELTKYVKKASLFLGASKVGIADIDENWIYSHKVSLYSTSIDEKQEENFPKVSLPVGVDKAIVLAIEMDKQGFQCTPTFLEFAAAGQGYSKMAVVISSVAQFIRNMGYIAIPCANDTGLSVPMAIDAGLGALGRIGILITPEFGPRVRLCKILTNMPLNPDGPDTQFIEKITSFCQSCNKCVESCEFGAISSVEQPNYEIKCLSNNPGVQKWYDQTFFEKVCGQVFFEEVCGQVF